MRQYLGVAVAWLAAVIAFATASSEDYLTALPPPTGKYRVGKKKLEVHFVNPRDPLAPNNVTTAFLATAFYPTDVEGKTLPYLDPTTAYLYEKLYNVSHGSLTSLTAKLAMDAPGVSVSNAPTLIFGPGGGGPPCEVYTILLSDLASHGYTVLGLDHPYEQPFIRWPNGTGLYGLSLFQDTDFSEDALLDVRIRESRAMLDQLHVVEKALGITLNRRLIGALGHSFGGANAVSVEQVDKRVVSAINMDGSFAGRLARNDSSADVIKPVWLMGSDAHEYNGTESDDPTWATFPKQQTGWWRYTVFNGSLHVDLSDITFWKTARGVHSMNLGPIDGYRMSNITRSWTRYFFEYTLLGSTKAESYFNRPSADWPEVEFKAGSNGTHK